MAFNILEVLAEIGQNGLLRDNKFDVQMTIPPAFSAYSVTNLSQFQSVQGRLNLYVQEAAIPGVAILTHPVWRYSYGPTEERPLEPKFAPLPLTIRADAGGYLLAYFTEWVRLVCGFTQMAGGSGSGSYGSILSINGAVPNMVPYETSYKTDYMSTVTITVYNDGGGPAIQRVLREAFPIMIGDISLDWDSRGRFLKIPVVLSYLDWFEQIGAAATAPSSGSAVVSA
jgi:hypothetical protein